MKKKKPYQSLFLLTMLANCTSRQFSHQLSDRRKTCAVPKRQSLAKKNFYIHNPSSTINKLSRTVQAYKYFKLHSIRKEKLNNSPGLQDLEFLEEWYQFPVPSKQDVHNRNVTWRATCTLFYSFHLA